MLRLLKFQNEQEKEKMELFLQHCNVIIRTMCTKDHIDNLDQFEDYCLEANVLMCQLFPWKSVAGSSHLLFCHLGFAIRKNGGHGLFQIYEGIYQKLASVESICRGLLI